MKFRIATLLLALTVVTGECRADLKAGMDAYDKSDFATAIKEFEPLAQAGNAEAQNLLGMIAQYGKGIRVNYKAALYWYSKAAEQQHPSAQNNLGYMYFWGQGVAEDPKNAVAWYLQSAQQGNRPARTNLGIAIERGWPGMPHDRELAYAVYVSSGNKVALEFIEKLKKVWPGKDGVATGNRLGERLSRSADFTAELNLLAQERAAEMEKLVATAESGNAEAQFKLAEALGGGDRIEYNLKASIAWMRKAAEQGHAAAQNVHAYNLRECGEEATLDARCTEAIAMLERSADKGYTKSMLDLGELYAAYKCPHHDAAKALQWLQLAWKAGQTSATHDIQEMYAEDPQARNFTEALRWARIAMKQVNEDPHAQEVAVAPFTIGLINFIWFALERHASDASLALGANDQKTFMRLAQRNAESLLRGAIQELLVTGKGVAYGVRGDGSSRLEFGLSLRPNLSILVIARKFENNQVKTVFAATTDPTGKEQLASKPENTDLAEFGIKSGNGNLPRFPRPFDSAPGK